MSYGSPSAISVVSGDGQSAQVATPFFGQALVVQVVDEIGDPVPGVNVTFASPAVTDGVFFGTFNTTFPSTTDADGQRRRHLQARRPAGTYTVTASVDGAPGTEVLRSRHPTRPALLTT